MMVGLAFPALASPRCTVPRADWCPVEEPTADLTAKGWAIRNIKAEDGCSEVYGRDQDGKRGCMSPGCWSKAALTATKRPLSDEGRG